MLEMSARDAINLAKLALDRALLCSNPVQLADELMQAMDEITGAWQAGFESTKENAA